VPAGSAPNDPPSPQDGSAAWRRSYCLLHAYGRANRGDAWIVDALSEFIGPPLVEVAASTGAEAALVPPWVPAGAKSYDAARAAIVSLLVAVLPSRALRAWRVTSATFDVIARCDMAISKGGSFVLSWRGISGWVHLLQVLAPLSAARRCAVPVVVAGQSFGPFGSRAQERYARHVVRRATRVVARDPDSAEWSHGALLPDIALASRALADVCRQGSRPAERHGRLVLSMVGREYFERHLGWAALDSICTAVRDIAIENDLQVDLFTQVVGPELGDDDRPVLEAVRTTLTEAGVAVGPIDSHPSRVSKLCDARLVVSMRLHTAVAAAHAGAPLVALSYLGPKAQGLVDWVEGVAVLDARVTGPELRRVMDDVLAAGRTSQIPPAVRQAWLQEIDVWCRL
jgi:polysaccharide pyruvyl transferase WcaK-like protein